MLAILTTFQVLGIIMVGTGVLMSQLLVEHVLDTTADEENRMWVYATGQMIAKLKVLGFSGYPYRRIPEAWHWASSTVLK